MAPCPASLPASLLLPWKCCLGSLALGSLPLTPLLPLGLACLLPSRNPGRVVVSLVRLPSRLQPLSPCAGGPPALAGKASAAQPSTRPPITASQPPSWRRSLQLGPDALGFSEPGLCFLPAHNGHIELARTSHPLTSKSRGFFLLGPRPSVSVCFVFLSF